MNEWCDGVDESGWINVRVDKWIWEEMSECESGYEVREGVRVKRYVGKRKAKTVRETYGKWTCKDNHEE